MGVLDAIASIFLGRLHLSVGGKQQLVDGRVRFEQDGADTHGQGPVQSARDGFEARFRNRLPDTLGDLLGIRLVCPREIDGEFVAADAPDKIAASHRSTDDCGDRAERLVAGGIADLLVEASEMIHVDHQQRARPPPCRRARCNDVDCRGEQRAGEA